MKVLFVHKYLGAFGGAKENIHLTAKELLRRGRVALPYPLQARAAWCQTFSQCFRFREQVQPEALQQVVQIFQPDLTSL